MENKEFYKKLSNVTEEYRKILSAEFETRWKSMTLDLSKSAEYEVICGLVSRQTSMVYQMSYSFLTWNEFFLPIIMRCMVENYINLSWILKDPEERSKMFIDYGLGRETKHLEFAKSKKVKTDIDNQFIQNTENWINQQRNSFLNKINVGSWRIWEFNDVRRTAKDANEKEYYDIFYDVCSSAAHSTWNYIAKHNLNMCDNPLHRKHRIPIIKEPEIEIEMFLILTKILQDTFEKIDKELGLDSSSPSSFEYITMAFHEED